MFTSFSPIWRRYEHLDFHFFVRNLVEWYVKHVFYETT